VEPAQRPADRSGQAQLGEERRAPAAVTGNRRAVAEDEPPALAPRLPGDGGEQTVGLRIVEREQGELFVTIEPGDEPRRPAAEPSAARVEHDGAPEVVARVVPASTGLP
jgi:hypothetical protein